MAMRKEQVLLLVAAGLGALVWKSGLGGEWRVPVLQQDKLEYQAQAVPTAPLLTTPAPAATTRRWFREPSETQPLPPRELPFPARAPWPFVALPLDPGPDLSRADLLLVPGATVADVVLQPTAAAPVEPNVEQPAPHETVEEKEKRYAKIYDRVWIEGQSKPHYGILRAPGHDLLALEEAAAGELAEVVVHLLEFSISKEKLAPPEATFGADARLKVVDIALADNLRNIVARQVRKVPEDAARVADRLLLIDRLLLLAQKDGAVYPELLRQVDVLQRTSAGLVAERTKARVLEAKGDIAGEFAVYQAIAAADGPAAALRHEGLGKLQARLGLQAAAEADLRRATELAPSDARPFASLAAFLRRHGRAQPALAAANVALATIGSVAEPADRQTVLAVVVACLLGTGDVDGARAALQAQSLGDGREAEALRSFLRAAIDYTAGNVAAARDGYRAAMAAGHGAAAQLGLGACLCRLGEWQEAYAAFEAVADQAPLLRHRAHAGMALLHLRLGQNDAAMGWVDRALEANPQDAYAHYLRAHALAGQGQLTAALESLQQVLRWRDDFVPAVAMVGELHLRLFTEGAPKDQAEHALTAMRYADRAVGLSPRPLGTLFELQALAHYRGADLRSAAAAFARARDAATEAPQQLFAQAGLAVCDYAMDHVDEARPQLERIQEGLAREHPIRQWAMATMLMIDDHAQKEQLDDHFERDEPGQIWRQDRDGGLGPSIVDRQLTFVGTFSKPAAEVAATRDRAVQKAGRFLATSCKMQLGPTHGAEAFAGLRIQTSRGAGQSNEFSARIGASEGKLWWEIREGKEEPLRSPRDTDWTPGQHTLELRVEDRGENLLRLVMLLDGVVVQKKDLTLLRAVDQGRELETALVVVAGSRPGHVDVRFDDYHLERRKD